MRSKSYKAATSGVVSSKIHAASFSELRTINIFFSQGHRAPLCLRIRGFLGPTFSLQTSVKKTEKWNNGFLSQSNNCSL